MKPLYKIFLVEDEIVTREGIRERIDWKSAGFEFCGEAPDGEIALPMIRTLKPDVLITDIKMPFMNGLELAKIVHETMPEVRTVILSGHDEFEFAREAIKLGVVEYLLKPISPADLMEVLQKIIQDFEKENAEQERIKGLQERENLPLERDKLLMQLVLGGISSMEALEKSIQLGINLIARCYQVILIKVEFNIDNSDKFDYSLYEKTEHSINEVVNRDLDVISFKKGLGETVIILKNDSIAHLEQDCYLLSETVKEEVRKNTNSQINIGISTPCERLGDLPRAFFEAVKASQSTLAIASSIQEPGNRLAEELPSLDPDATDRYLNYGIKNDFDKYFKAFTRSVLQGSQTKRLFLEYIYLDVLLTAANFINDLGGDANKILPGLAHCEKVAGKLETQEQVREEVRQILILALDFRDKRSGSQTTALVGRARQYIDSHFENPDISLNSMASYVNLSPSHFSVVFSRETGETFIGYFTRKRIEKAKELLRSTSLRTFEISDRIGYENPHYFSTVFKKITGFSPTEYRNQAHPNDITV